MAKVNERKKADKSAKSGKTSAKKIANDELVIEQKEPQALEIVANNKNEKEKMKKEKTNKKAKNEENKEQLNSISEKVESSQKTKKTSNKEAKEVKSDNFVANVTSNDNIKEEIIDNNVKVDNSKDKKVKKATKTTKSKKTSKKEDTNENKSKDNQENNSEVTKQIVIEVPAPKKYKKEVEKEDEPVAIKRDPNVRYSDEDLAIFKKKILDSRKEAIEELQMLKERLDDLTSSDMAEESMIYSMHMAEQGSEAIEKEKTYAQMTRINEYIKKLDEALLRIDDKTYGICRVCGCLIAKERLLAVPITTLSASYKIHKKCPEDGIDRIEPLRKM